jgi:hypothetical protein
MRNRSARIGAALALILAVFAPTASAQDSAPAPTQKPAKKPAKKKTPPPPPEPEPDPTPPPEPPPPVIAAPVTAPVVEADVKVNTNATPAWDEFDVTEKDGHKYYFVGARYRGYVIPQAFMNIFVSGGATVFSNSGGIEMDIRKDGFSLIPNLSYTSYSTGDMLFLQHDQPDNNPGNWSLVNSGLKVIYAGTDLLWSIHLTKNLDFELGMGFQLGVVFGTLVDNWVTPAAANATYTNLSGQKVPALSGGSVVPGYTGPAVPGGSQGLPSFVPCTGTGPAGCNIGDHNGATIAKVGGYQEPHGFNPVPTVVANISIPQIGLRIKPIKSFVARISAGFNIPNGVWFGFSGDYGLESLLDKK